MSGIGSLRSHVRRRSHRSTPDRRPCATLQDPVVGAGAGGPGDVFTDPSGNYEFHLKFAVSDAVTPYQSPEIPGSPGINTVDVVAVQQHFLMIGTPLSGCRLAAADVNGDDSIDTLDVVAIERFFLGVSNGIANVGKYQFNPSSRCFVGQPNQNFDTLIFGDVAPPFVY